MRHLATCLDCQRARKRGHPYCDACLKKFLQQSKLINQALHGRRLDPDPPAYGWALIAALVALFAAVLVLVFT